VLDTRAKELALRVWTDDPHVVPASLLMSAHLDDSFCRNDIRWALYVKVQSNLTPKYVGIVGLTLKESGVLSMVNFNLHVASLVFR